MNKGKEKDRGLATPARSALTTFARVAAMVLLQLLKQSLLMEQSRYQGTLRKTGRLPTLPPRLR